MSMLTDHKGSNENTMEERQWVITDRVQLSITAELQGNLFRDASLIYI